MRMTTSKSMRMLIVTKKNLSLLKHFKKIWGKNIFLMCEEMYHFCSILKIEKKLLQLFAYNLKKNP